MNVIFVGGIHGVGKSTACKRIAAEFGINCYTASEIIRQERASAIQASSKLVANVADNQRLLILGISRLALSGPIILDGHFTILRASDGEIEPLHEEVYRQIGVRAIVVLIDAPSSIADRLEARDKAAPSVEFLQNHQDVEVENARHIAAMLDVPISELSVFDTTNIASVIKGWVS